MNDPRPTLQARLVTAAVATLDDPHATDDELRDARTLLQRGGHVVDRDAIQTWIEALDPVTRHRIRDLVRTLR